MSEIAVQVENLSKRYRIGLREERHDMMFSAATSWLRSPLSNYRQVRNLSRFDDSVDGEDVIWALKDLSFEVKRGEVIGVIGRNGAGKSTLLKILSRITEPSSGRAMIQGRVASLLEVGTGFHPELTGRENVYLNGTILGMKKVEIDRKLDQIVSFSGVERFIDTPVKRYSSGMKVRLSFAVAANLDPEILLVDEVLAVGDAAFQKKCLGKMRRVVGEGRTVLFVSHNMAAVNELCGRTLVLHAGELAFEGPSSQSVNRYLELNGGRPIRSRIDATKLRGKRSGGLAEIKTIELRDDSGEGRVRFAIGESIVIQLEIAIFGEIHRASMGIEVVSPMGVPLLNLRTESQGLDFGPYRAGQTVHFTVRLPGLPFYPGVYELRPWFAERGGKRIDYVYEGFGIELDCRGRFRSERMIQDGRGLLIMDCDWEDRVETR